MVTQKNLLLINADQLRHDCVGYRGIRNVKTPCLDALARESVVYENAFTPLPVCAPARQAILSGRHPDSFGALWNYDVCPTPTVTPDMAWPSQLKDAGYATAYLGRFHVSPTLKPADFGYERHVSWADHKKLLAEKYASAQYTGGWLGCESPVALEDSGTHWMADRACETMKELVQTGKPWHMWVDYEEPHLPCRPSAPYSTMYDPKDIAPWDGFADDFSKKPYIQKQQTFSWQTDTLTWEDFAPMVARYFGVISQLDNAIGRILAKLEALGQKDNTIVVFTSDHGDMCASHHMLDKHYVLYDDILRVPFLVRVPGVSHSVMHSFVYNCLDMPYSIREWLGVGQRGVFHGQMLPLTKEEDEKGRSDIVCTANGQQMGLYTTRTLHEVRYKYIYNATDTDEFYDLESDPGECNNLINQEEYADRIADMRKRLYDYLSTHGDPFVKNEWMKHQLLDGAIVSRAF